MINYKLKTINREYCTGKSIDGVDLYFQGKIKSGWKTQSQLASENAEAQKYGAPIVEKGESRVVVDSPEHEIILNSTYLNGSDFLSKNPEFNEDVEILNRTIVDVEHKEATGVEGTEGYVAEVLEVSHQEYYYIVPEINHLEFYTTANYSIELIDTDSEAYKKEHYQELREREYPSMQEITVALWESVVENKHDAKNTLQAKRDAVKLKYPKNVK